MKKTERVVVGRWRITSMEMWDADYYDMEVPAFLAIRDNLRGEFQFGLVQGDLDGRVSLDGGLSRLEFCWEGGDENDPASGRGWMVVKGDQAEGRFLCHEGDESNFTAVRQDR
jgi:hypothetical protein